MSAKETPQVLVETYRPQIIYTVAHQTLVTSAWRNTTCATATRSHFVHILLYARPDTCKISKVLGLVRQLSRPALIRFPPLELSAADSCDTILIHRKNRKSPETAVAAFYSPFASRKSHSQPRAVLSTSTATLQLSSLSLLQGIFVSPQSCRATLSAIEI